ncbi:hypothetical protein K443DRAFT_16077 [Laccaria amethystina LaAM-08-1]|uniref:Uncharacterized protein n=1 Tax=Laccaria amethystina LaAM-08-1 TaxID=1095629 RepID=A0A0C9WYH6_9AGAR|nr:hypothetical protein K443DRAFT_16077 [Laccaria amethystina LaAM-08-1]
MSAKSSQTYQYISHHISETSRAPPYISEYYSSTTHAFSEYSDLRTFPIRLPQHSRYNGMEEAGLEEFWVAGYG